MKNNIKMMLCLTTCLIFVGCGGEVLETVKVSGVLTMNGKPLDKVQVTFMPDTESGSAGGSSSVGETDASGRYNLTMKLPKGKSKEGALVGPHKVVLSDLRPNDVRNAEEDMPSKIMRSRIIPKYTSPTTTDLTAQVEPGESATVDLDVKWK